MVSLSKACKPPLVRIKVRSLSTKNTSMISAKIGTLSKVSKVVSNVDHQSQSAYCGCLVVWSELNLAKCPSLGFRKCDFHLNHSPSFRWLIRSWIPNIFERQFDQSSQSPKVSRSSENTSKPFRNLSRPIKLLWATNVAQWTTGNIRGSMKSMMTCCKRLVIRTMRLGRFVS